MNVMQQFLLLVFIGTTIVVFFIEDVINLILRRLKMNKNEREHLYYLIEKYLEVSPEYTNEEQRAGVSVLVTIQQCEKSKETYQKAIKELQRMIDIWEDDEDEE